MTLQALLDVIGRLWTNPTRDLPTWTWKLLNQLPVIRPEKKA